MTPEDLGQACLLKGGWNADTDMENLFFKRKFFPFVEDQLSLLVAEFWWRERAWFPKRPEDQCQQSGFGLPCPDPEG